MGSDLCAFAARAGQAQGRTPALEGQGGWRYFFHGFECAFSNRHSGQHLDIVFGYENQWGVLDAYFFETFVKSTSAHHALAALFQLPFADAQRTLDVLESKGYFVRVPTSPRFFGQKKGLVVASPEQIEALLLSPNQNAR